MNYRYAGYIRPLFLTGDMLLLNAAFIIGYYLKFENLSRVFEPPYVTLLIFANLVWLLIASTTRSYSFSRVTPVAKVLRGLFVYILLHMLIISTFWVYQKAYYYSREYLVLVYTVLTIFLFVLRTGGLYLLRIYRLRGYNYRNVVIFGYGVVAEELHKFFRLHPESGYKFLGYFSNKEKGPKILGNYHTLQEFAVDKNIDEIYCCIPYVQYEQIQKLISFGEENLIKVKLISDFRGFSLKGLELERYDHIPVLSVSSIPLDDIKNRFVKRGFDILFSFMFIVLILSWLYPLLAILIKLDSKGPILFRQPRTGKGNNDFICYKFRTMKINSDSDRVQASKNDSRITRFGRFLRRTSLDEFPQFFNVFMGEMSVVGPRPHMLSHTLEYSKRVEKFMSRHFVKPGITGLAQSMGYRGETKELLQMKNRVKLDRFYVENWSLLFDFKILMLTAVTLYKERDKAF